MHHSLDLQTSEMTSPTSTLLPPTTRQSTKVCETQSLLHDWISRAELAAELGLCVETLRRWADARRGPKFIRAGRKILYRRATVLAWLESQETTGTLEANHATHSRSHRSAKKSPRRMGGWT